MYYDLKVSFKYIYENTPKMKWYLLRYGYLNEYIDMGNIISYAMITLDDMSNELEFEISMLDIEEKRRFLQLLDILGGSKKNINTDLWIYILLKWFYEIDFELKDKFIVLNILYKRFGEPKNLDVLMYFVNSQTTVEEKFYAWENAILIYKELAFLE